ncbi:MAG: glycosyltransferase family 4 protein [Solirubrobacteraceae bacterium]
MPGRSLRIAWLGAVPSARESGGVPGVAAELLHGLAALGHRIDCFSASAEHKLPERLTEDQNLTFTFGSTGWRWGRWYSRTKIAAFASGLFARGLGALRLRRELARRHRQEPYDLIYQFSNIETLSVPSSVARHAPLVIHPETHAAGELRFLIAERQLSFRCQPRRIFVIAVAIMSLRTLVQRVRIRRARLLVCISNAFRSHLSHDYGFPLDATVVIPNPVRLERFTASERVLGEPPTVLVLGRIAVRKGIEDVVEVARTLLERDVDIHMRVVGGPGLWSDYTKLLEDLPENAEYLRRISPSEIPNELSQTDVLLQASKYEPFALTVAEALAAGVPVVATSEVGAIEGVDRSVVIEVEPGDVAGIATAITDMLGRVRADASQTRSTARAEAERLFAPDVVCEKISAALIALVDGTRADERAVPAAQAVGADAPADSHELS